jgi:hypothetical protein
VKSELLGPNSVTPAPLSNSTVTNSTYPEAPCSLPCSSNLSPKRVRSIMIGANACWLEYHWWENLKSLRLTSAKLVIL